MQAEAEEELRRQHATYAEVRCRAADSVDVLPPGKAIGLMRGLRAILVPEKQAMNEILTSSCLQEQTERRLEADLAVQAELFSAEEWSGTLGLSSAARGASDLPSSSASVSTANWTGRNVSAGPNLSAMLPR